MDIVANLREYIECDGGIEGIKPLERYASFDYCFNYFQSFRERNRFEELIDAEHLEQSCLQLGFYLASWGMLRGSSPLLGKSARFYEAVIGAVVQADRALWDVDADCYTATSIELLLDFERRLFSTLKSPTDTLTTKIMLGVFGNVPAFDSYFKKGFRTAGFNRSSLKRIGEFYATNRAVIDKHRRPTIEFLSGNPTRRVYTCAKVIDMIFFVEGARQWAKPGAMC